MDPKCKEIDMDVFSKSDYGPSNHWRVLDNQELMNVSGGNAAVGIAGSWASSVAGFATGALIGGTRGALIGGFAGFALGAAIGVGFHFANNNFSKH